MRRYLKIVIKIAITVVLLVCLRLYSLSEMRFIFNPYIDTIFADDFDWDNFDKITVGASKENVVSLIGKPLGRHNYNNPDPNYECWQYSTDGKLWPYADFSYYLVQVCFRGDTVESKPVYEFCN